MKKIINKTKKEKKIPKEISQEILKKVFASLLHAIGLIVYFIVLFLAFKNIKQERLINDIEIFAGGFLVVGIIIIEKAYKEDSDYLALNGIEFLILSIHSLSIMHIITLLNLDLKTYLFISSLAFAVYYALKAIILYTKGRKEYLLSLSDINEIVKKEEPIKKEAKKRRKTKKIDN